MENTSTYYLAGPMTGYPEFNVPAFREAKKILESEKGFKIELPYDIDSSAQPDWVWEDYLAEDIKIICRDCTGIVLLPEWERSRGAKLEVAAGLMQSLKYPEFKFFEYYSSWPGKKFNVIESTKESIASIWYDWWDSYNKEAING